MPVYRMSGMRVITQGVRLCAVGNHTLFFPRLKTGRFRAAVSRVGNAASSSVLPRRVAWMLP
jgi:hypothetical protein